MVARQSDKSIPLIGWGREEIVTRSFYSVDKLGILPQDYSRGFYRHANFNRVSIVGCFADKCIKCKGPKKDAVSIQSEPCAKGAKQVWMRDGTPAPPKTNEQLRASQLKRWKDAEDARALSRMADTDTDRQTNSVVYYNNSNVDNAKQRCNSAKQQPKGIRDRDWRHLTIERLRQLDAWVVSECKAR